MKNTARLLGLTACLLLSANAWCKDTNLFVFLCFGQSNMEGFPGIEEQDKGPADERFQMLACVDFPRLDRVKGRWYPAVPPLCRPSSGLSPADYFGRTLVAQLPPPIKVGVVNVSVAGCKIELFDKDTFRTYAATAPNWMTNIIAGYGGNPYEHLVAMARQAQQDGVIKGILLHQGESNTNDREWPRKVQGIYQNLLRDLQLTAAEVPLLVGELVPEDQKGACASMNRIIRDLPQTIPTAHVVSSQGCTARPDHLHFTPAGYRELGKRYGDTMLQLLGYGAAAGAGPSPPARSTTLKIDVARPGTRISPELFGAFFEDLNYAADGGLYAELVQNRSFEYSPTEQPSWHPSSFWDLQKRGGGEGSLTVSAMRPLHPNNPHYALLTVQKPGDGVGIANDGFGGIPLKANETYRASFWAYQAYMGVMWGPGDQTQPMPLTCRLESRDGQVLAEEKLEIRGRDWHHVAIHLKPARDVSDARLVLLAHAPGALCLDMVSLFPTTTFRGRPNGLRADLAQAIADLRPRFLRFPGGCLVHAAGVHQYYNWKDSVGPVEQRRARPNFAWGYHQTLGLGYLEYFQFCEDLGAQPLPVVSAGVCCQHAGHSPGRGQEGLPLEEMPAYIQDVLDLIEWANGPASSRWGSLRAAAGHPAPFGLKYLGVGNEDEISPAFKDRFSLIFRALRKKHPEIVVVGTSGPFAAGRDYDEGWKLARQLKVPLVDEHYYVAPQWFWENQRRYDAYDRHGPQVYVGEYAAHDAQRRNTLRSALAEAAGMTAFERNGEVVRFASYAPLLARRGHTQWHPDLIYFTGTQVFRTANYFVQQLFGQNSGDTSLPVTAAGASQSAALAASAVRDSRSGDLIVKLVNGDAASLAVNLEIPGLPSKPWRITHTVLTGPTADAVNEDGQQAAVRPVSREMPFRADPAIEAPPFSLTVLRFH